MKIATLPWYDLREVRPALDGLWASVASRLRAAGLSNVPSHLMRGEDYESQWHDERLLLGQACGYDMVLDERPPLKIVATPHFDLDGCSGPTYRSFIVVPESSHAEELEDLRGTHCVINNVTSHSGANSLRALLVSRLDVGQRFFSRVTVSGSHERSIAMLQRGEADIATIDCVTWGLLKLHRPEELEGVRIIDRTAPAPAPPFVTHIRTPPHLVSHLRAALSGAIARLSPGTAEALRLRSISVLRRTDYEPIAAMARAADRSGCHELRAASLG